MPDLTSAPADSRVFLDDLIANVIAPAQLGRVLSDHRKPERESAVDASVVESATS
jgi:hypothetical protein